MQVKEFASRLCCNLTIPFSERVVTAFNMLAIRPFVARSQADQNGRGTLLAAVIDEFLQIPPKAINHLIDVLCGRLHAADATGVSCARYLAAMLTAMQLTDVVVAKLNEHEVARLEVIVNLVPTAFLQVCARRATCLSTIDVCDLVLVEDAPSLRAPAPHASAVLVGILHCRIASYEHHRLTRFTTYACGGQGQIHLHGLQRLQLRMRRGCYALSSTACIELCAKLGGVDVVEIEVVVKLPR